jgi:hypothetical protein
MGRDASHAAARATDAVLVLAQAPTDAVLVLVQDVALAPAPDAVLVSAPDAALGPVPDAALAPAPDAAPVPAVAQCRDPLGRDACPARRRLAARADALRHPPPASRGSCPVATQMAVNNYSAAVSPTPDSVVPRRND